MILYLNYLLIYQYKDEKIKGFIVKNGRILVNRANINVKQHTNTIIFYDLQGFCIQKTFIVCIFLPIDRPLLLPNQGSHLQ